MRPYAWLAVTWLTVAVGAAAQAPTLTADQRAAILAFPLTLERSNALIAAMTDVTKYLVAQPDYPARLKRSASLPPSERIAQMEADATIAGILARTHLTARDYLVGVPALRMAIYAADGATGSTIVASPANVAFAKANLAELKPKLARADGLAK